MVALNLYLYGDPGGRKPSPTRHRSKGSVDSKTLPDADTEPSKSE